MQYHLFIVAEEQPGQPPIFTPLGTVTSEAPNPILEARIATECFAALNRAVSDPLADGSTGAPKMAQAGSRSGRPGNKVSIRAIDPDMVSYIPLSVGDVVNSSMELSLLMGYRYNMVTQKISLAKKAKEKLLHGIIDPIERERIESEPLEITLRGVTFCYVEELAKNED